MLVKVNYRVIKMYPFVDKKLQVIIIKVVMIDVAREMSIKTIYQRVKEILLSCKSEVKIVIKHISVKVTSLLIKSYPQANQK